MTPRREKRDLEISLEKNLLDLEYNQNLSFFVNCLILCTTILGLGLSSIALLKIDVLTNEGSLILAGSLIGSSIPLILAYQYRKKYKENFNKIQSLLLEVKSTK